VFKIFSIFLLLCPCLISGDEEDPTSLVETNLANLESEPSSIVGSVNVITGDFVDFDKDIVVMGPLPLAFERSKDNSGYFGLLGGGWNHNWHGRLIYHRKKIGRSHNKYNVTYEGPHGEQLSFSSKTGSEKEVDVPVSSIHYDYGLTNCGSGEISGKTHLANTTFHRNRTTDECIITRGDGSELHFKKSKDSLYLIDYEILPNLNQLTYEYEPYKNCVGDKEYKIHRVVARNRLGKELAWMKFQISDIWQKEHHDRITTSDGRQITFSFHQHKVVSNGRDLENWGLHAIYREAAPQASFEHIKDDSLCRGWITDKKLPQGRGTQLEYYRYKHVNHYPEGTLKFKDRYDFRVSKVKRVLAPLGKTNHPLAQHQFFYEKEKHHKQEEHGVTHVWDALRNKTIYTHRKMRLESIEKLDKKGERKTLERLLWGEEDSPFNCNLMCRTLENAKGELLFERNYIYDEHHNVTREETLGNICGRGERDLLVKESRYSNDGMNLLVWQNDGENTLEFTYYPKTNLVESKIQTGKDGLRLRYFYEYDDSAVMIREILDDGTGTKEGDLTGITERKERVITPNAKGLPKKVLEYYLDSQGQKQLLSKEVNHYNPLGHLLSQDVYDADNVLRYTLEWDYDKMGNVTREKNALGQEIHREYDENGNLVWQQGPSLDFHKKWKYDFMNRMICSQEVHSDHVFSTHCEYNLLGERTHETDEYGNTTEFIYSQKQLIETKTAPVGEQHQPITLKKKYDDLGYVNKEIDGDGNRLHYKNTLFGKIYSKEYPDGSFDICEYDLQNRQTLKIARNGLKTVYDYDSQGRLLRETCDSIVIKEACYNTFHLLSETDASGLTTTYEYDRAGRKIGLQRGDYVERYEYDALGRLVKLTTPCLIAVKDYDLLNRVVDEQSFDLQGTLLSHVSYVVDEMGRKIRTHTYTDDDVLVDMWRYNSRGDLVWHKDALGQVTRNIYRHNFYNEFGQKVLQHEMIDPMGQRMITTLDAIGRVVSVEQKNPFGIAVQKRDYSYDARGNKIRSAEIVFPDDRKVENTWDWDSLNQLVAVTEGVGTPEQKRTRYTYNTYGQKTSVKKPDGTEISYTYDLFGRVSTLKSDNILYEYSYDAMDQIIEVKDGVAGTTTTRVYDSAHHMVQENLAHGITLNYRWDNGGRLRELSIPNEGSVHYTYQGSHLKTVVRYDDACQEKYSATYLHYDLSGKIRKLALPGNVELNYEYDALKRVTSLSALSWSQRALEYDLSGNLLSFQICDRETRFTYDDLSQLTSEKGEFNHSYIHDSLYNLVDRDGIKTSYNAINQPLDVEQTYDSNGNLISSGDRVFRYDALDRLIQVQTPSEKLHFTYDAFNRRLTKNEASFIYQGDHEIGMIEKGCLKQFRTLGGHGSGAEIGASLALELEGQVYAPIHDHRGNISALFDTAGTLIASFTYSAFGESHSSNDVDNPWLFSSKRLDSETGLYYFGRRYYDPSSHRWLSADPIKFDGGQNLYAYVLNNPLIHLDEYGLFPSFTLNFSFDFADFFNAVCSLLTLPGRTIEYVGRNWVPVPLVRDLIERSGRLLAGRTFENYVPYWRRDPTCCETFEGRDRKGGIAYLINGMNVKYKEGREMARQLSESLGGASVRFTYNGSSGIITDLIECTLQKLGIMTAPDYALREDIKSIVDMSGGPGSDFKIFTVAHSQGGIILNNLAYSLSAEYLKHVHPRTLSGASIITDSRFGSVMNYVNLADFAGYLDLIGLFKASLRNQVIFVKPERAMPFDHSFDGPTNRKSRQSLAEEFNDLFPE
jgi:RHS repeat-associated protein